MGVLPAIVYAPKFVTVSWGSNGFFLFPGLVLIYNLKVIGNALDKVLHIWVIELGSVLSWVFGGCRRAAACLRVSA